MTEKSHFLMDMTGIVNLCFILEDGEGKFGLIEMNEYHSMNDVQRGRIVLHNVAQAVGINFSTGKF